MTRAIHDTPTRGRVLVLDPDGTLAAALDSLAEAPLATRNIFEAIGAIATAPPRQAVRIALLVDEPAVARHAAALRRVDPSVRLIRVGGSSDPGERSLFDDVVPDPGALRTLLGAGWFRGESDSIAPAREAPVAVEPPAPVAVPVPEVRPDALVDDPPLVALADAFLTHPEGAFEAALAAVRAALPDAAWSATDPADGTASAVRWDDHTFGWLQADASAERRQAWADWLGRWCALDQRYRAYRTMAYRDDLTGSWNRRYYERFLADTIEVARARRRPITVMVFDIDDFKHYNDTYGHDAGDVILRETVALLTSVIRDCDRVCRIGGDEFAVIFADLDAPREEGSTHPASVTAIARRFQQQIALMRFPKLGLQAPGTLSISGGLATFPWDSDDPAELLRLADNRALASKRRGKDDLTFGPGAPDAPPA